MHGMFRGERPGAPLLRGVRRIARALLSFMSLREPALGEVLRRLRSTARHSAAAPFGRALTQKLHTEAACRAHPAQPRRAGRRTQAGDRAVRRHQRIDGADPRRRPGRRAADPRPDDRGDDDRHSSLRGHGQQGFGRRHHGAVRCPDSPRRSCGARLLRRARSAEGTERAIGADQARLRHRGASPDRDSLGRGRGSHDWQRSDDGLRRDRPDDASRLENGAAR